MDNDLNAKPKQSVSKLLVLKIQNAAVAYAALWSVKIGWLFCKGL